MLDQLKTSNGSEDRDKARMRFYQDLTEFLEREPEKYDQQNVPFSVNE